MVGINENGTLGEIYKMISLGQVAYPKDAVGIELELESSDESDCCHRAMMFVSGPGYWTYHPEDSLRNGFELVLQKPLVPDSPGYKEALKTLDGFLTQNKKDLIISPRTSLHMHVNAQPFTIDQIYNIILNSYLFENIISHRCSANRHGNLFCMRGCDAEAGLYLLAENIKKGDRIFRNLSSTTFKYGALNLSTLHTLNTIEYRIMDATLDTMEIDLWAKGLTTFVRKAAYTNIHKQIAKIQSGTFSLKSACKDIMGDYFSFFAGDINFNSTSSDLMVHDNVLGIMHVLSALRKKTARKFSYVDDTGNTISHQSMSNNYLEVATDGYFDIDGEMESVEDYEDEDMF